MGLCGSVPEVNVTINAKDVDAQGAIEAAKKYSEYRKAAIENLKKYAAEEKAEDKFTKSDDFDKFIAKSDAATKENFDEQVADLAEALEGQDIIVKLFDAAFEAAAKEVDGWSDVPAAMQTKAKDKAREKTFATLSYALAKLDLCKASLPKDGEATEAKAGEGKATEEKAGEQKATEEKAGEQKADEKAAPAADAADGK